MYRRFRLRNSLGETWDLADTSIKTFLNEPQGLGYSNSFETTQYGNVLSIVKEETAFPVVSGSVYFYDDSIDDKYMMYNQFVVFLSYTPLVLEYDVPSVGTFYLDVMVQGLGKSDVGLNNILSCPLSLQGLGMWYGLKQRTTGTGKVIRLVNPGQMPCGMEITITGSLKNPYFTLTQDNEIYGKAKFESNTAFDSVYVNSGDGEQKVVLMQENAILSNPLSYQDLTISNGAIYVTFVKLARGASTLNIGFDSGTLSSANVDFCPRYRSV